MGDFSFNIYSNIQALKMLDASAKVLYIYDDAELMMVYHNVKRMLTMI